MTRRITRMTALLLLTAVGCGGISEEEARSRCTEERTANAACTTDQSYAECVACYDECGDSCLQLDSCPVQYACPE